MTETIKETIDKSMLGYGVFFDLQKTFDTVNHSILINKLEYYGTREVGLDWVSTYLSDRKQYVSVNGATSDYLEITCGVSPGLLLDPLLS